MRSAPAVLALTLVSGVAYAAPTDSSVVESKAAPSGSTLVEDGATLPVALGARHDAAQAVVVFSSGYDWARSTPSFELGAELRLWGPFTLRGGGVYTDNGDTLRPSVGLIWQAARRQDHGVDVAVSVAYEPEGFTEPEGEIETVVAIGRHFGGLVGVVNLAYGQDPEANEQDAEARLAVYGFVARPLAIGFDSRLRYAIATKPGSKEDGRVYDLIAGPIASLAVDRWALTAQAGVSVLGLDAGTKSGAALVGGVATIF